MSLTDSVPRLQFHHSGMSLDHLPSTRDGPDSSQVRGSSPATFLDSAPWTSSYAAPRTNGHLKGHEERLSPRESESNYAVDPDLSYEDQNYVQASSDHPYHADEEMGGHHVAEHHAVEQPSVQDMDGHQAVEHYAVEHPSVEDMNGHHVEPVNAVPEPHDQPGIDYTVCLKDTSLPTAVLEPVMAPFDYINSLPSKGVRDKLVKALNVWIDASDEALESVKSIVGDVHNLSLMLDDVQDNSPMRRAKPATHCVFGMPQTVNSATYQIVDVISRALRLDDADSAKAVIDEMRNLLIGQAHDLVWTHLVSAPTVEGYLRMVDGKTGGLFRMISRLMIAQSKSPTKPVNLDRLMTLFGRFFQIRDDYANLVSDQYTKTKGFAEDLDEGKFSFIVIHALLHADAAHRRLLENLFMQRRAQGSATDCHKELVIEVLHRTGSLEFTAKALQELRSDLEDEIRHVEVVTGRENPAVRGIISALKI